MIGREWEAAERHELPSLDETREWIGFKLDDVDGRQTGRVEGVLVDSQDGLPAWLLIRVGRFGHRSALPFDHAAAGADHVWAPYSRELIRAAPEVRPEPGLRVEQEIALCDHFGLPPHSRRRRELEVRRGEAPTAVVADL